MDDNGAGVGAKEGEGEREVPQQLDEESGFGAPSTHQVVDVATATNVVCTSKQSSRVNKESK